MRYRIAKRKEGDEDVASRASWAWALTYPDGSRCLCFNQRSAVDIMEQQIHAARSAIAHAEYMKRRYCPA